MGQTEDLVDTSVPTSGNGSPQAVEAIQQQRQPDGLSVLLDHLRRRTDAPRVVFVAPTHFQDCRRMGNALASGDVVILDVRDTEDAIARRTVDFASGAVFVLAGSMSIIADRVYVVEPGIRAPTTTAPTPTG